MGGKYRFVIARSFPTMHSPTTASFLLWGLAGFTATALALGPRVAPAHAVPQLGDVATASAAPDALAWLLQAAPATDQRPAAPAATSRLKLSGILFSEDPAQSRALIQSGNEAPRLWATGAQLPSGETLARIEKKRVQLHAGTNSLELALPETP